MLVNKDNFIQALRVLLNSKSDRIVMDLETNGLNPYAGHRLIGVALLVDGQPFYYPYRHGSGDNLPFGTLAVLFKAMARFKVWTGWNIKFDIKFVEADGGQLPERVEDVMLAAHLMNENEPDFKLKRRGKHYIDPDASDEEEMLADRLRAMGYGKGMMWILDALEVYEYAEMDVILTEKLRAFYEPHLRTWELWDLWQDVNHYLYVVHAIERRGLLLDIPEIETRIKECVDNAAKILDTLETQTGIKINLNSVPQVKSVLAGYGVIVPNTKAATLEELDHPVAQMIVDYRRWNKARSAYYQKFLEFKDPTGVLHPNLMMTGTVTGRFASKDPNMMALPRDEDEFQPKTLVKSAFKPRPGYVLVQCDYKQAEIYLGAAYASAKKLFQFLRAGIDVHKETGKLLGIPRSIAKQLNFSIQYGVGPVRFQALMWEKGKQRITLEEAQAYIDQYRTIHPEMRELYKFCLRRAESRGYIRLFTGRVRHFNDMVVSTALQRASKPASASNSLIQGGVAEMMRLAATELYKQMAGEDVHQLMHVHDSIIFEVPVGRVDLMDRIADIMTDPKVINVCTKYGPRQIATRFKVDVEIGQQSWHELIPLADYKASLQAG